MATLAERLQTNPWGYGGLPEAGPVDPTGALTQWNPTSGENEAFRLRQAYGPVGHRMAPMSQWLIDNGGVPGAVVSGLIEQPAKTGKAIETAVKDPSPGTLANAGVQVGASILPVSPAAGAKVALGSLGAGYTAAAAEQAGVNPLDAIISEAMAKGKGAKKEAIPEIADLPGLSPEQNSEYKRTRLRIDSGDFENGAARRSLEENRRRLEAVSDKFVEGNRALEAEAKGRKEKDAQETYDRAVKAAEGRRDATRATNTSFKDSPVGKVYEATGGMAPMLMGLAGGALHKLNAGAGTTAMSKYGLPAAEGAGLTFAGLNAPLVYDSFNTPTANPEKEALRAYVMDAPEGDPKRAQYERELAKAPDQGGMPDTNVVKEKAWKELTDPMGLVRRAGTAVAEGVPAGITGRNLPGGAKASVEAAGSAIPSLRTGWNRAMGEGSVEAEKALIAAERARDASRISADMRSVEQEVARRSGRNMADVLEGAPAPRQAPQPASSQSAPGQTASQPPANQSPVNVTPEVVNGQLTAIPHPSNFQPRKNGKFAGPPDKDALDAAIRAAMGEK